MQKRALFILFFLFSCGIFSQTHLLSPSEIYIGSTQGATASMVLFKPKVEQDFLLGYNGGILFRYVNEKYKALQVELNFTQRGWQEKENLYARRLNYLELPFMSHFYYGDKTRVFINIGPQFAFLLSEKVVQNNTEESTLENHNSNIPNRLNYGFCLGFGGQFTVMKQMFQIEARGNMSLNSIFSTDKKDYFKNSNNIHISLNLAWLIRIR